MKLQSGDRIVFFGDSITAGGFFFGGYVALVKEAFRKRGLNVEVINAGVSGDTVVDLENRVAIDVLAAKPTHVVIYIGINDVWEQQGGGGTSSERFHLGLERLVLKLRDSKIQVALCTPSVIGELPSGKNELDPLLDAYADVTRAVATKYALPLCDLRKAFVTYLNDHNTERRESGILTSDGVHLSRQGDELVRDEMLKILVSSHEIN